MDFAALKRRFPAYIELTPLEVWFAITISTQRIREAEELHREHRWKNPGDAVRHGKFGCIGEMATCFFLGDHWLSYLTCGAVDSPGGNVKGSEVKRADQRVSLFLPAAYEFGPDKIDVPHILAVLAWETTIGKYGDKVLPVFFPGWITPREAQKVGIHEPEGSYHNGAECWRVPCERLHPMSELKFRHPKWSSLERSRYPDPCVAQR